MTKKLLGAVFPYNTRSKASLIRWISPFEFYIRLHSYEHKLNSLTKEMQAFYKTRGVKFEDINHSEDCIVAAFDSHTSEYVRCQIIGPMNEEIKLICLDYGYEITCSDQDIYELDSSFFALPATAVRCSLYRLIINHDRDETHKRIKLCVNVDTMENIQCEFIDASSPLEFIKRDDNVAYVELFLKDDISFTNLLAENDIISILPAHKGSFLSTKK